MNQRFEDLTISKAKSRIIHLKNLKEVKEQELNIKFPLPKSTSMENERVNGGTREDKMMTYMVDKEKLENQIIAIECEIKALEAFIEKEIDRLNEYDEWEQKVIYLKDEGKTYFQIALKTPFSERTCRRIYKKYKESKKIKVGR